LIVDSEWLMELMVNRQYIRRKLYSVLGKTAHNPERSTA